MNNCKALLTFSHQRTQLPSAPSLNPSFYLIKGYHGHDSNEQTSFINLVTWATVLALHFSLMCCCYNGKYILNWTSTAKRIINYERIFQHSKIYMHFFKLCYNNNIEHYLCIYIHPNIYIVYKIYIFYRPYMNPRHINHFENVKHFLLTLFPQQCFIGKSTNHTMIQN